MSIELITKEHNVEIYDLFKNSEKEILIISPFIGRKTSEKLAEIVKSKKLECKIITRFYRDDFIQGVSSLEGLKYLLDAGCQIYALKSLHSKLYIFDDLASIITSANFTNGGLISNIELGLKCYEEDLIIEKCKLYFSDLWKAISISFKTNGNEGKVNHQIIDNEIDFIRDCRNKRDKSTNNSNNKKWGATVKSTINVDSFEDVFITEQIGDIEAAGWIKFGADANHRHDGNKSYFEGQEMFLRDKTFFPKSRKPIGIKKNHKIYLSLVSNDINGHPVPMIVGYAFSDGFQQGDTMNKNKEGWESWMENYPHYINLRNGKVMKGPAMYGISMHDLYSEVKQNVFPTTVIKTNMKIEDLRHYHYRRDKIRITNVAEEYLDNKLNKLFEEYGYEDI